MKKIISLIITALILISVNLTLPVCAAEKVELKINSLTVYAGDEFELNLFISDNSQMSGAVIDVNYDSKMLEFVSSQEGAILDENATISIKNIDKQDKSYVRFTYMSPSSSVTSEGILLTITFKALETVSGKTPVEISIPHAGDFVNADLEKLPYTIKNSTINVLNTTLATEEPSVEETTSEVITESNSIETSTESTTEKTELNQDNINSNDNVKLVIGIIAAGVVILLAVIIYVVLEKSKKSKR